MLKHEPKVELTDEKLLDIYFLEAPGKEIKDLTGLEKCKNLALIKLTKNKISDLKPLKDLANLQSLDLAQNEIKDISPLAGCKALQYIELSGNKIEKIDALKDLTAMNSLYLGNNEIKDIAPLAGLNKLWTLSMPKNKIKDISVLSKITKLSTIDLQRQQDRRPRSPRQANRAPALDDRTKQDQGLEAPGRRGQGRLGRPQEIRALPAPLLRGQPDTRRNARRPRSRPSRPPKSESRID